LGLIHHSRGGRPWWVCAQFIDPLGMHLLGCVALEAMYQKKIVIVVTDVCLGKVLIFPFNIKNIWLIAQKYKNIKPNCTNKTWMMKDPKGPPFQSW
jgi:hypothetical protein